MAAPDWQFEHGNFLIMATRKGRIKRTVLSEYDGVRPSGLIAVNLDNDDSLDWVKITTGEDELIFVTRQGMALRFHERTVRPMGRAAGGVNAMRLKKGDVVTAVDLVKPDADLFVITTKGYGKRSPLAEYRSLGRYNQGVRTIDIARLAEIGEIVDGRVVEDGTELTVITDRGIIIRTSTDEISRMGRLTRGVRVIRLDSGQKVAAVAYMPGRAADDGEDDGEGEGEGDGERDGTREGRTAVADAVDADGAADEAREDDGDVPSAER